MPSKKAMNIHIPTALRHHNIRLKTFLSRHKQYTNLAVDVFIFYPPRAGIILPPPAGYIMMRANSAMGIDIEPGRLLILQRAPIVSDIWEVHGGACELTDRTILHSVARVTLEKTGLHLKKFVRQIGEGEEFKTSEGLGFRLNLEIEVAELAEVGSIEKCPTLDDVKIVLDRDLHQEFMWATRDDILHDIFPVITPEQKVSIMQAFSLRREDEQEIKALAVKEEKAFREEEYAEKVRKGEEYAEKMRKMGKNPVELGADEDDDQDDDQDDGDDDEEDDDVDGEGPESPGNSLYQTREEVIEEILAQGFKVRGT